MKQEAATIDFTAGNPLTQMSRFGIPLLIGNLFQQLYSIVDSMLLGKLVSQEALAAAGTVIPLISLSLAIISGFTLGTSLVTASLAGQRETARVRQLVESTVLLDLGIGVVLAAVFLLFAEPILQWMRTPEAVMEPACRYLRIVSVGMVFQCLYQYMTDILRGLGDSRTPLLFLILSTVLNIVLDLLFIAAFHMDVAGVAYATLLSQVTAAVCCLIYSLKKYECFRIRFSGIDRELLYRSARLGLPSAMQQTVGSLGAIGLQSVVNGFGAAAMNGYNAAYKVDNFIMLPVTTMGVSLSTFVAQNTGAGLKERVREGFRVTSVTCGALSVFFSAIIFVWAEWLVGLFIPMSEAETIAIGAWGLRVLAVPYVLCSQSNIYLNFFKGAGDARVTLWASIAQTVIRLAICFSLSPVPAIGMNAVWFSMPVTWVLVMAFSFVYYRKGIWQKAKI